MKLKVAVLGHGRMGQEIQRCIESSNDLALAGVWTRGTGAGGLSGILKTADIAVDFTLPEATEELIQAVSKEKIPLVCGVSGLTESSRQNIIDAARAVPILYDRNMSLGVAILQRLVQVAGAALGELFETEIHETHHVHKMDAPSGTALQLGEALADSRGQVFSEVCHYDPSDNSEPDSGQISFAVTRRGEVYGDHTVLFKSASESLSLEHRVNDRRVFAEGALKAAQWLVKQPPGFYSMQDVVRQQDH